MNVLNVKWMRTIRLRIDRWGEIDVPAGYAVVETSKVETVEEASRLPNGAIRLGEQEGVLLLAIPAPGIHAWHPLFGFRDQDEPPAIPHTDPHPVYPAWSCRVCEKNVVVEGGYAQMVWAENPDGVWCSDHLPEAFSPFRLIYPTFPLLNEVLERWHRGEEKGDPLPEPGPWPPVSWIASEAIREAFDASQGKAPPVTVAARCPSCGADGLLTVQETQWGREVEAPCKHLERAVEVLARGPLMFAWGGRPGWTILPAGLVGPMGYRFAAPENLSLVTVVDRIWVGLALDETEALALTHPDHLPCGVSREDILPANLMNFLSDRMWIGREVAGAIIFERGSRKQEAAGRQPRPSG